MHRTQTANAESDVAFCTEKPSLTRFAEAERGLHNRGVGDWLALRLHYGAPDLSWSGDHAFIGFQVENRSDEYLTEYVQIYALHGAPQTLKEVLVGWEACRVAPGEYRRVHFFSEVISRGEEEARAADGSGEPLLEIQIRSLSLIRARLVCSRRFALIKNPR